MNVKLMDEKLNIDKMQKCDKCGLLVENEKCIGCDENPQKCTCPVSTEETK